MLQKFTNVMKDVLQLHSNEPAINYKTFIYELLKNFTFYELGYCKKEINETPYVYIANDPLGIIEQIECIIDEIEEEIEDDIFFAFFQSKPILDYLVPESVDNTEQISKKEFHTFFNYTDYDRWCQNCEEEKNLLWIKDENCSMSWFTCPDLCEEESEKEESIYNKVPYQICYDFFDCDSKHCYYHHCNGWKRCTNGCNGSKEKHEENCIADTPILDSEEEAEYEANKKREAEEKEAKRKEQLETERKRKIEEDAKKRKRNSKKRKNN